MCSQEVLLMANLWTPEWGRQWKQATLVFSQVEVVMDFHRESHLVQNMNLGELPLLICHEGSLLVHNMELSSALMVRCQLGR